MGTRTKIKNKLKKVMGTSDILVVAFGAMIGWGWVVSSGRWIQSAGTIGTVIGFIIGGIMIYFVGMTYAELTPAMPKDGGEHVFSYKAFGPTGSFICTWAVILSYTGVVCFEAVSLPTIISSVFPSFNQVYLYTVAGSDVYLTGVILASVCSLGIIVINIFGIKDASILQTVLTVTIAAVGVILFIASVINGDSANLEGQVLAGEGFEEIAREREGFYGQCLLAESTAVEEPVKKYPPSFERIVYLEGSRGCAWGQKQACAFCSGNRFKNVYREKTPIFLYEEIKRTLDRWPEAFIQLSDNMLGPAMYRELLPMLKADGRCSGRLFAEVLSTLKEEDLRALGEAGFSQVQPGIESLNDHLLQLLGKGSTGVRNVAFLKYAGTWKVTPLWNMLFGIPGEREEDYEELISLLPLLSHLPPPREFGPIAFVRFSRYWRDPEAFGLELSPQLSNRYLWGDDDDRIKNMSVYYRVSGGAFKEVNERNKALYIRLGGIVEEWRRLWGQKHVDLRMTQSPERISVLDTRPCAVQLFTRLEGIYREIYSMAWNPLSPEAARRAFAGRYTPQEVDAAAQELIEHRIMIRLSGMYLALAVPWSGGANGGADAAVPEL